MDGCAVGSPLLERRGIKGQVRDCDTDCVTDCICCWIRYADCAGLCKGYFTCAEFLRGRKCRLSISRRPWFSVLAAIGILHATLGTSRTEAELRPKLNLFLLRLK